MKRIIMLLLAAAFVVGAMAIPVSAEAGGVAAVSSTSGNPGDTVSMSIGLSGVPAASSVGIRFQLPEGLELVEGQWLLGGGVLKDVNPEAGTAVFALEEAADLNGEILSFRVKINTQTPGTYAIDAAVEVKNLDAVVCSTQAEGSLTVLPPHSEIHRIAGDGRCQTAMEAAEELKKIQGVSKFQTILVADGNNYPDALSGSYLAAVADAPILLVQANQKKVTQTVKEYILGNLTADATVYILGGTNSIPTSFETDIRTAGYTVKRLAGNDRYLTSLMIIQEGDALLAQQGKAPADSLLVCAGGGYADSLSASATGRPVLLVNGGKTALTTSQKNYLDSIGKRNIYIIGGPNSVSDAIATQLNAYDTDGATKRIAGDGREETSAKVAQEFFPNADFAVLADGNNYPDGLSGGPVAYAKDAPLLLIRAKRESHARDYVGDQIKNGYILGGPNSVSDNSAKVIFGENTIIK